MNGLLIMTDMSKATPKQCYGETKGLEQPENGEPVIVKYMTARGIKKVWHSEVL